VDAKAEDALKAQRVIEAAIKSFETGVGGEPMKIGVNSVLFGGHDMEIAFRCTQTCGYDGIEISAIDGMSEHLVLDRWQEIAPR
jgi:hypothetical protein